MENVVSAFLRPAPVRPALARTELQRVVAPATISSMAFSGIGETSASRIITQWALWRRQAFEQMLLSTAIDRDSEILSVASLQAVSTMLDASFVVRARAAADNDGGSRRCALVRQIERERTSPGQQSSPRVRRASQGKGDSHVKQRRDTPNPPSLCGWQQRRTHVVARELQRLSEHRAVSAFAHRDCIESFLRGRFFFHGGWPMHEDEGSVPMAATGELGQLEQSLPVTNDQVTNRSLGDSEHNGFTDQVLRDHEENAPANHEQTTVQSHVEDLSVNEEINRYDHADSWSSEQGSEQYGFSSTTLSDNIVQPNEGEGGAFLDGDGDQHSIDSQESTYNNWFSHLVDGFYGVDLPELLTRRSVSNLLSSSFGENLGQQLIQSYARRQELVERQMLNRAASVNGNHVDHAINEPNQAEHDRPWIVSSGQGPMRRQWYWTRPEFVFDAIKDLEMDMAGLFRGMASMEDGMASMQDMIEKCMAMQVEVQRCIKQEVSAAMNRSIGVQGSDEEQLVDPSRWHLVSKGTCCICCENQIDSLLYRCGHMCTCSKCANELLLNGDGKCPMCRAPIFDVVRAYTS